MSRSLITLPLRAAGAIAERVLFAAAAICGLQVPAFMAQYIQRLGGHLDEARLDLAQFAGIAPGGDLHRLAVQYALNPDPAIARTGAWLSAKIDRVDQLQQAFTQLRHGSPLERAWSFFASFDPDIARRTLESYQLSVPLTLEALVYGLAAGFAVSLAWRATGRGLVAARRGFTRRRAA